MSTRNQPVRLITLYTVAGISCPIAPIPTSKILGAGVYHRSELDEIGIRHGTELSSLGRDHLRHWQLFLQPLRGEAFDLLEIGIGTGASLRTWREWFPDARLVGLDARRIVLDPPIDGCVVIHGNQTDQSTLRELVRSYRFRFVVDDGSSHGDDKIASFLSLFPWLEPESVYACAWLSQPEPPNTFNHEQEGNKINVAQSQTVSAWFAKLGLELAGQRTNDSREPDHVRLNDVLERAVAVSLFRDSVVVTS